MTVLAQAVSVLPGLLAALSVLVLTPRAYRLRAVGARAGRRPGRRRSRTGSSPPVTMEIVVTQVAGLLRSGMPPQRAWQLVGGLRVDVHGVPDAGDLARRVRAGAGVVGRSTTRTRVVRMLASLTPGRGRSLGETQAERQAAAVVAACRLAAEVGAPLAAVLESIVATLVAAAEAEAERDAALAGPQTTARVLLWLPVVGAVLGSALGADPVRLVLDGGPTAVAPVAGVVLLLVGRTWSTRLTDRARVAGSPA